MRLEKIHLNDLPIDVSQKRRLGKWECIITEFIRSGADASEIKDLPVEAEKTKMCITNAIYRNKLSNTVKCRQSGNRVFLVRCDDTKGEEK